MAGRIERVGVELVDVNGSFKRMVAEAPKLAKKLMGTAVFLTARSVLKNMESAAPVGPDGEGLTPDEHIREDLTENWKATRPLVASVGILGSGDNPQAHVALWNEYSPDRQPFMRPAAHANADYYLKVATEAMKSLENKLADGVRD